MRAGSSLRGAPLLNTQTCETLLWMSAQRDWSTWGTSLLAPRMLCVALAGSCGIYAALMVLGMLPAGAQSELAYVLPAMGLLMFPAGFLAPRLVPMPEISSSTKEAPGVFGEETVLADPQDARRAFVGAAMTHHVLRCALHEAIAIFGLVGFVVGGTPLPIAVGLCGVSAITTLTAFPRTEDWKKRAETKLRARFPEE